MKIRNRSKILVIVGPTASGKSALAIDLAKKFDGEIISADSRQVYRGLDIGTGKVTKKEMLGVPHYLLDIASPKRTVNAHEYAEKARAAIQAIIARGRLPIVVGGTGFYIDALLGNIQLPDVAPDQALRARLQKKSAAQLYALLKRKNPRRAAMMNTPSERNNKIRLIRALEIAAAKRPHSRRAKRSSLQLDVLWIGIAPKEKELERRIRARLKVRIRSGMVAEAKHLHAGGLSYKRMEQLGLEYRSLARLLRGDLTRSQFEDELYRDIRRYAKKQMAYWKRHPFIIWSSSSNSPNINRSILVWQAAHGSFLLRTDAPRAR